MEVVEGETVFVCNKCLYYKQEIPKHIKYNHRILLNDDNYTESELYEGFDG